MSKQKKEISTKLRFPEFCTHPAWSWDFGNHLFEQISDKKHNCDLPILAITQEYGAIPREMINYNVSVSEKGIQSYKVVNIGDFIISLRSFQGGIEYSKYKGLCSPAYIVLRNSNRNEIDDDFFKQYFKTSSFIFDLTRNLEGLRDGKMISYKQFSEILLPKPSLKEQNKIAACLSSIDDLITLESRKLDTLKNHKKGLIQQLFPAEGETLPKIRFKEFRDKPTWKVKSLSEVCEINPSSERLPETFVYIDLESVENGELQKKQIIDKKSAPSRAQRLLRDSDIIFQMVRPYQKNNYFFQSMEDNLRYVASTGYALLRAHESHAYLYQYLYNDRFVHRVLEKCTGSNYPAINSTHLSEILVEIPEEEEQKKIAECLHILDESINAQNRKIKSLEAHKKGLVQQLFPVMVEVNS